MRKLSFSKICSAQGGGFFLVARKITKLCSSEAKLASNMTSSPPSQESKARNDSSLSALDRTFAARLYFPVPLALDEEEKEGDDNAAPWSERGAAVTLAAILRKDKIVTARKI